MGDIASLDQTLLSPRPLLHQLDLVGHCRTGSYQLKTSPYVYGCYDSNPLPNTAEHRLSPPLPPAGVNITALPLALPLGGARWTRNTNTPVARTLSSSSGTAKRLKTNNTAAQKRKVVNKRVTAVESAACTSSASAQRSDRNSYTDRSPLTITEQPKQQPSFPALQVPAVDSRSEAQSRRSNVTPFSPQSVLGMPSVKSKPGARPRKMERRILRQKRASVSTPALQKTTCSFLEARNITDDCISKDMDEVTRMALRSSNYDWSRRVPDGQRNQEDGYNYAVARCIAGQQQRSVQDSVASAAYTCHQTLTGVGPQQLQQQQSGYVVAGGSAGTQENCHGYLYSAASAISPDLLMQGATLMGETGPAAEKLKQIAAQHQMKESSRYAAEIEGYVVDDYPGYAYRQATELYPVGTQYPLTVTPYREPAYLLPVQYPARMNPDTDMNPESGFGTTKPLSHYPVNTLTQANQIAPPPDLDSTNQERLLYRDTKRPVSLTNRQAISYGETNHRNVDSFHGTMSANRVPPAEYNASDDDVINSVTHRAMMMEQYGRQLQNTRMFASEYNKQGDALACHVTAVPTPDEAPSSRSLQCGGSDELARRSVQPPPNSPFLSTPSAVSYSTSIMDVELTTGTADLCRTLGGDPRWSLPGHHPYVGEMSVLADINGNGEFPDLTGHSSGLDGSISSSSGKQKLQPCSGLVSPAASGYQYAPESSAQSSISFSDRGDAVVQGNGRPPYSAREMRGVMVGDFSEHSGSWSSQGGPQGTSGFDVNPAQWGKYYQNNNTFSVSPYHSAGNSLFPKGVAARNDGTLASSTIEFNGNRWATSSSSSERNPHHHPQRNGSHLAPCKYSSSSSSSNSNSSSSSSTTPASAAAAPVASTTAAVSAASSSAADFVGSACEEDAELFSYVDDDSPTELNFIDDLLSATR